MGAALATGGKTRAAASSMRSPIPRRRIPRFIFVGFPVGAVMAQFPRGHVLGSRTTTIAVGLQICPEGVCRGRSKFSPLRRHKMQVLSTDGSKGRTVLTLL